VAVDGYRQEKLLNGATMRCIDWQRTLQDCGLTQVEMD
jgi:hypothetical protein